MLAGQKRRNPFPKHRIVDFGTHVLQGGIHIRVHQLDPSQKLGKHAFYRWVQILQVFLHRRLDVLIAQIGCSNDG